MRPESPASDFLNPAEARVLGCLLEKEVTTPENYPLSLNALANACNQKSNRNPVLLLEDATVRQAADSLRAKGLVMMFHGAESRVPKFKHTLGNIYELNAPERAVLCELLLRGPQTPGELRSRAGRLHAFDGLAAVEEALRSLMDFPLKPLATALPRQPGQKEQRYLHLLSGISDQEPAAETSTTPTLGGPDRLVELEAEIARLRRDVDELKAALGLGGHTE